MLQTQRSTGLLDLLQEHSVRGCVVLLWILVVVFRPDALRAMDLPDVQHFLYSLANYVVRGF
jgi:hypothetical protein